MRGGVLRNSNWRARVFQPAVQKCQTDDDTFPSITPHDLRHTAASLAVSAGANVKAVQRMLGHAKASMTLDVYADLFDEDLDSVAVHLTRARSLADGGHHRHPEQPPSRSYELSSSGCAVLDYGGGRLRAAAMRADLFTAVSDWA